MNNLKVFVFIVFFAVLVLPVMAEPNNTAPAQQAIKNPCQIITAAPELVTPPQPQITSTEQIIEKAHQYYNSELNKALIVISILATILTGLFILVALLFELQRNRSFKDQLDKKEKQLQKYLADRLIEETKTLKEDAQKQLDTVIHGVRHDLGYIYLNLSFVYDEFYRNSKSGEELGFAIYLKLMSSLNGIDIGRYDIAAEYFNDVKERLVNITEGRHLGLIDTAIELLSKRISEIEDGKLQKAFKELNEAFIVRKHELGYTGSADEEEDKQE